MSSIFEHLFFQMVHRLNWIRREPNCAFIFAQFSRIVTGVCVGGRLMTPDQELKLIRSHQFSSSIKSIRVVVVALFHHRSVTRWGRNFFAKWIIKFSNLLSKKFAYSVKHLPKDDQIVAAQ